jgi:hypothetical protein
MSSRHSVFKATRYVTPKGLGRERCLVANSLTGGEAEKIPVATLAFLGGTAP